MFMTHRPQSDSILAMAGLFVVDLSPMGKKNESRVNILIARRLV